MHSRGAITATVDSSTLGRDLTVNSHVASCIVVVGCSMLSWGTKRVVSGQLAWILAATAMDCGARMLPYGAIICLISISLSAGASGRENFVLPAIRSRKKTA